jgi:hypothetical protein
MKRLFGIAVLATLGACSNEAQSGSRGTAGEGGGGGNSGASGEFPLEGPYMTVREDTDDLVYFFPEEIESEETWPSLVWFNGASGYTEDFNYNGLLESVASWGFVVVGGKSAGMNPSEVDQRDALLERNADSADALFARIDQDRISVAGHSLGGFQTTTVSAQYRVAVAIQGAGAPTGTEAAPTLFMTSEGDETVEASVIETAFRAAINEAWLANHATADHNDPRTDGGVYREPVIAFLRWQLREDSTGEAWFIGENCALCTDPSWSFED